MSKRRDNLGECWDVNDQACFDRERRRRKRQGNLAGRSTPIKTLAKAVAKNAKAYQEARACAVEGLKTWRDHTHTALAKNAKALNNSIQAVLDLEECDPNVEGEEGCADHDRLRDLADNLSINDDIDLPSATELIECALDWVRDPHDDHQELLEAIGEPLAPRPTCRRKS